MNKQDFISAIAAKTGLTKKDTESTVDSMMEVVQETLVEGEQISLIGFGTFKTKHRAARQGRNPQTGATIQIDAAVLPELKFSKNVKDALN